MYITIIVTLASLASNARAVEVELTFNSRTGRIRCEADKRPTHSVYWDQIAQDVAAAAAKGPTISSGLYAMMHSAMFDAWKVSMSSNYRSPARHYGYRNPNYRPISNFGDEFTPGYNPACTLKKLSMSHAAIFTITEIIPQQSRKAEKAFNKLHMGCEYKRYFATSRAIGNRAAKDVIARYSKKILPGDQPKYSHTSFIEKWRPERVPIDSRNGRLQKFLTSGWGLRYTFGIRDGSDVAVKNPVSFLLVPGELDMNTGTITLTNNTKLKVSLDLVGTVINPQFIEQSDHIIKASRDLTEMQKYIAEFWEQGAQTSFPPGAWMTIAQYVSYRDDHTDDEDVGLFYAMGNAMNDAGVSTWYLKLFYNYARPVRAIRDLGKLNLIDRREFYSIARGGVISERVTKFTTYQKPTEDPSPPFPEYTSGHSTFSSAGAEVLRRWTGSDTFGASVSLQVGESRFEPRKFPTREITLDWKTFTGAAEEAGASRIYGGIHFSDANTEGLESGRVIGRRAYWKALGEWSKQYFTKA